MPTARPITARGPKLGSNHHPNPTPTTIDPRLKKLEAIAGTPKTLRAFSIPIASAASDASRMKGYITRVRVIASAAFSPMNPGASVWTSHGAKPIPRMVRALTTMIVSVQILLARRHAVAVPAVAAVLLKIVVNAVDSAPSANRSRSRFGIRNAMVKASITQPPPNKAAPTCSRTSPNRRLHKTASPTTPAAFVFSFSVRAGAAGSVMDRCGMPVNPALYYNEGSQSDDLIATALPDTRVSAGSFSKAARSACSIC